jgi:hypothetical protein
MDKVKEREIMVKIKDNFTGWLLNIVLLGMIVTIGMLCYWHFREYDILAPSTGNFTLEKTEYYQGEEFSIPFRICKNLPIRERSIGRFIDGVIFSRPDIESNFKVGCYDTYLTSVSIPETLPAGTYKYEETIIYRVNPIKEVVYEFSTQEFTVMEKCKDCSE